MTGVFSNFGIVSASSAYKATSLHLLSQGHNESTWTMITGAAGDYGAGRVTAFTQGALYSMANVASRELAGINIRFNEMYLYLRVDFDGPGTVCPLEFAGKSENIQESDNAVQSSRKRKRRDANATVQSVIESSDDSVRNPEGSARDVPEATPIDLDIGGEPTRCASEAGERSASAAPIEDERQSTTSFLANELPSESVMVSLLEEYFNSVHWFSLVIYEPRFRLAFNAIRKERAHPSQRIFLLLLSVVLGLGAWYRGQRSYTVGQPTSEQSKSWSAKLIANAESQIIELLDHSSVTAVQTLTLLGSFYVYHGRPNLSFSLLGAVVKLAHANGLHREPQSVSDAEKEERKRVWWTIYTWDKFSSVTYGRPVSIHDDDCNVSMPEDVEESIDFKNESLSDSKICFSAYQRELNKLYLLASPAINQIYSATERTARKAHGYVSLVEEVTSQLWQWRQSLPEHLLLCTLEDCPTLLDLKRKAHYLQSLSLYLTFDSLLIILHRPFLGPQLEVLQYHGLGGNHGLGVSGLRDPHPRDPSLPRRTSSFEEDAVLSGYKSQEQWRRAANRTASTIELPQLTELACDGHLVAFLALNLFNAAIVMIVLALSSPLTDAAQEAKRAVARIYRLQEALGPRSSLSKRSIVVLRDLIMLLSRQETEAMLRNITPASSIRTTYHSGTPSRVPYAFDQEMSEMAPVDWTTPCAGSSSAPRESILEPSHSRFGHGMAFAQQDSRPVPAENFPDLSLVTDNHITEAHSFDNGGNLSQLGLTPAAVPDGWSVGSAAASNGLQWFWDPM
ncbi:hypothetical protein D0868_01461 [Hortaea werneckii]|uniref:Xylanolytic transcriptional activator regulatory domain-containing protein n=1 Tax=Hortaea werneckii TaxID=91943 RepID=A0A3M6ZGI7_HORWE|nr:hypothetical protein D0868_01461 [Hortaea werneckii]